MYIKVYLVEKKSYIFLSYCMKINIYIHVFKKNVKILMVRFETK